MYRTVNETMPLTTFGTDNGRECAAGVNEPKVVHRWVGSSSLPRHGWGWVGLARLAIIASTIDLIALRDSPLVPSLSLFSSFPFPFFPRSSLPFLFVSSQLAALLIRPRLYLVRFRPSTVGDETRRGIGIFGKIVSNHRGNDRYFFLFRTRRKGKGTHALFLRAISLRSLLVAVVVPFASQPVPTFATRSLLPDAVPLRLVSVRVLFLRASVHTFAHAFSSARLPRHPSSSLKRFFPLRGGSSPRFSSPPTYLPLLFMRAVRSGGGIRVYMRAPALETLIFREIISPRKAVPKRTRDNWTKRDETRRHSNGSIPTVTYIHPDPNNPLCPARCRTDYDTIRDHSILRKRGEEKEREALKNLPTLTAKLPTIEGKALFRGTGEEANDRMPKEERKGKEKESR